MKFAAITLVVVLAVPAAADEIVLKNGARIEGRVVEAGNEVTVVMDAGTITFKRSQVVKIILSPSVLQEFDEKVKQLKADDKDGRYKLALWAKQRELDNRAKRLLEEIVVLDPDHAGARGELGYVKHDGRWMTEDEKRAAEGFIHFRGAWVKQAEAEAVLQREADRATKYAIESEMVSAQKALLEAQADYERAKAESERVRAQIEKDRHDVLNRSTPAVVVWHVHRVGPGNVRCCCNQKR
jgi:hypothetical protein